MFRVMQDEECNFLEQLGRKEFIHFRKRVTSLILATDMSKHSEMMSQMKQVIQIHGINEEGDVSKWLKDNKEWDEVDELNLFKN